MFGQSIVVHRTAAAAVLDQNELRANWACKAPAAGGGHRGSCTEHLASPPLRPQFRRVNFPLQATSLPSARLTVCIIHHERPAIGRSSARQRAAGRRTPARSYALMSQGYHSAVISAGTAAGSAAVARRAAQFPHSTCACALWVLPILGECVVLLRSTIQHFSNQCRTRNGSLRERRYLRRT